jgi:hypothetical protein
MHLGDIRAVLAVNYPDLMEFFNVIIFSSKGKRPEHNKMANGDLDGDVY